MASFVYYKFRSQKHESRIQFNGTGISVFELKRAILLDNNVGKANDFVLALYDHHDEEYKDDTTIIPRSSSVIVSRLPADRPGRARVAHYLARTDVPLSRPAAIGLCTTFTVPSNPMRNKIDTHEPPPVPTPPTSTSTSLSLTNDEAASIAAMFAATECQWEETQERMSHASRIPPTSTPGSTEASMQHSPALQQDFTHRPTPPGHVCYRCGQKGHWIQRCQASNGRGFDQRSRIKRTTGIPRSFLKAVDRPTDGSPTAGVMITPEGRYVVAQPDAAAWQKQTTRTKAFTEAEIRAEPPQAEMACTLCSHLFRDAVKTACCAAVYCEDCIQTHLSEHDFVCPACHSKIISLDNVVPEEGMRARVQAYIYQAIAATRSASSNAEKHFESDSGAPPKTLQASNRGFMDEIGSNAATAEQQQPARIQARIDEMQTVLKNPIFSQQVRMQQLTHLPQLMSQSEHARMIGAFAEAGLESASNGTANPSLDRGKAETGIRDYHPQRTNPLRNQQLTIAGNSYERLPVSDRRRGQKRDRPSDFLELAGDGPANKAARYWE